MDNWDVATPFKHRQAKWSIPDMELAIKLQCGFCNDVKVWAEDNDCVSPKCSLFPFRPGIQREEVDGVKRAKRRGQTETQRIASIATAAKHFSRPKT